MLTACASSVKSTACSRSVIFLAESGFLSSVEGKMSRVESKKSRVESKKSRVDLVRFSSS